jgi:hypothetical protein
MLLGCWMIGLLLLLSLPLLGCCWAVPVLPLGGSSLFAMEDAAADTTSLNMALDGRLLQAMRIIMIANNVEKTMVANGRIRIILCH